VDLLGDRALGQMKALGSARNATRVGDGEKGSDLLDGKSGLDPDILGGLMGAITNNGATEA
jgi:hypothetical protein